MYVTILVAIKSNLIFSACLKQTTAVDFEVSNFEEVFYDSCGVDAQLSGSNERFQRSNGSESYPCGDDLW